MYAMLNNVEQKKGIEGAPVSQLVIALSQSTEPWKPSQRWASYCAAAKEPALSLSAVPPHSLAN